MGKSDIWYPRYIGDYMKDTSHLSLVEHGVYTLLLDIYYATGKPIPADRVQVHRICKAFAPDEVAAVDTVLSTYFFFAEDGYHNSKADKELLKRCDISEKRKNAQAERERLRKEKGANAPILHQFCTTVCSTQSQSHKEEERKEDKSSFPKNDDLKMPRMIYDEPEEKKNVRKRSTRLPDDWQPSVQHIAKCSSLGLDSDELANGLNGFRNYHGSKGSLFIDWDKAFFTWIGNAQRFGAERQQRALAQRSDVRDVTGAALRAAENIRKKRDSS